MPVKFGNPPIHEMVIGARFAPQLRALRSEHIGLLWSRLGRKDFPNVHQKPPLGVPTPSETEFFPMPRFWLESKEEDKLIQVQKDAFLLNWRKRESEYPSFAGKLKPEFDRCFEIFEAFVHEDVDEPEIRIEHCEITYLDLIRPCEYWGGPKDTRNVIPSFVAPTCVTALDADASFDCTFSSMSRPTCGCRLGSALSRMAAIHHLHFWHSSLVHAGRWVVLPNLTPRSGTSRLMTRWLIASCA